MDRSAFFGSGSEEVIEKIRADNGEKVFDRKSGAGKRDKHGVLILQQKGSSDRQARALKYAK